MMMMVVVLMRPLPGSPRKRWDCRQPARCNKVAAAGAAEWLTGGPKEPFIGPTRLWLETAVRAARLAQPTQQADLRVPSRVQQTSRMLP